MLSTAAGDEVINADDLMPARKQQVGQVRAQETRPRRSTTEVGVRAEHFL